MSNARIDRLTREALGPRESCAYMKLDDTVLRAIAIVILILTVITIATWPRGDASEPQRTTASTPSS